MGMGATNTEQRVAASVGALNAVDIEFKLSQDVPNAGVLLALPSLLAVGLLRHTHKHFALPRGYYSMESLFLLLAFMALARKKSMESLRHCAPGEWGKLLGLDRIPEVRTMRNKLKIFTQAEGPTQWSADLCAEWMAAIPNDLSIFYVDGHVRVYSGNKASLPRHFVSRQKLCLRASVDYWVNALGGQPLCVLPQDVDPGLVEAVRQQIVPRLLQEVPNQPTAEELEADPLLHRFTIVFDREGYSPELLLELKKQRIACLTYHKYPGEDWEAVSFTPQTVKLVSGETVTMNLAERNTVLSNKIEVREVRRLTQSNHQTSVLSTDYKSDMMPVASAMFARWSQENYLKYMIQEYNLDGLISYGCEEIPDETRVVNPDRRQLEKQVRKVSAQLVSKRAQLQSATAAGQETEVDKRAEREQKRADLPPEIDRLEKDLQALKDQRKQVPKQVAASKLPGDPQTPDAPTESDSRVINPQRRQLDGAVRKAAAQLARKRAQLEAATLGSDTDAEVVAEQERKLGDLLLDIEGLAKDLAALKDRRKGIPKHVTVSELPADQRINRLTRQSKHFIDIIKMIAYRAESTMAQILREKMPRHRRDEARTVLKALYCNEADLIPEEQRKTLTVRLHHLASRSSSEAIQYLCDELNSTETIFPGTDLRLVYEMVSKISPSDREVEEHHSLLTDSQAADK